MTTITLNDDATIATAQLGPVRLTAFKDGRDKNGNPMYKVFVTGIMDRLPKLYLPVYTSHKKSYYLMQSHQGLQLMLKGFIVFHGEELQKLGELHK